jgi:putative nucleotidyltransferase with HDIG domain
MPLRRRRILVSQGLLVVVACALALALTDGQAWSQPDRLGALAVLAVASRLFPVTANGVHLSLSLAGLTLTMALAGPAPAAALGALAVGLDAVHHRPPAWRVLTDLVTVLTLCVVGGGVLQAVGVAGEPHAAGVDLAVIATVVLALTVLGSVLTGEQLRLHRPSLPPAARTLRTMLLPVAPWQLGSAAAAAAVLHAHTMGADAAVGLVALVLLTVQLLLRAVLSASHGAHALEARRADGERLQEGLLATTLRALALRDPGMARHSAAVSRHAREIARRVGCGPEEQELVHAAGLLHDIGKVSFDDAVLRRTTPLTAAQRARVRAHPADGARILRSVAGFQDVARLVEAHHERWDGTGYPVGLAGEEIPELARVLAVAEAYDTMTASDSYRPPLDHLAAVAELRRCAGSQFEPRLVEALADVVGADDRCRERSVLA